jgi:hypothetical protein
MNTMRARLAEILRRVPVRDGLDPDGELDALRRLNAVDAILDELREPDEGMYEAALKAFADDGGTMPGTRSTWQAMIDAARQS